MPSVRPYNKTRCSTVAAHFQQRKQIYTQQQSHRPGFGSANAQPSTTEVESGAMIISGLRDIIHKYKAVLLDQFGVLHDGKRPYPGAIAAVEQLHAAGVQVLIISNSSRRSGGTLRKLTKMGFKEDWFVGAITSGELTYQHLEQRPGPWWQNLGTRCIHITWSQRGLISLDGLGLQLVQQPEVADFILAHGTEGIAQVDGTVKESSVGELVDFVSSAAYQSQQPLPMVVANPDVVTVDGVDLAAMPGTLAHAYAKAGGKVVLMGKPDPVIYGACLAQLGLQKHEVLAVGDSLEHDIAGANRAYLDSLFVAGGILAAQCGLSTNSNGSLEGAQQSRGDLDLDVIAIDQLCTQYGCIPTYATAYFHW